MLMNLAITGPELTEFNPDSTISHWLTLVQEVDVVINKDYLDELEFYSF